MATTLEFDFNTTGISTLNTGTFTAGNNSLLVVDLANYEGGAADFTLVDSTALTGFNIANLSVINAGAYTYSFDQSVGDDIVFSVIPEPGTYALMGGLLALSCVMIRRRV
jgi:hypothetical protein